MTERARQKKLHYGETFSCVSTFLSSFCDTWQNKFILVGNEGGKKNVSLRLELKNLRCTRSGELHDSLKKEEKKC